ncbi:MAG: universal stress protein [Gammaproteobacteria bacterium]|jgi:nucleotide-binding universal stress UspA family protein|uniref:Nucleotide-binding universal stress protein, UspA family n=1 Tax=Marinomonas polaris DSM 16579 TaxID=1122206 RepID=A0A1M5I822_9GAMM|nr:universal stress protein [Marinomonas polaris]MBU1294703.1 universal stress protein [Gammaproteobacteria bacterium]MBU1468318.1 universal stress protein [Gammaproteobacteria bacterium]MBU2023490.1 universal stress protein [Gammaproteobacteria bacterium]MBU2240540.1 universal stress protein [Gammaproteobacteria bacterium]MBU2320420.1 universal stress protein [Gammaproteobacteria bacterium]|tara:strand:+ start:381 stop:863 length:483 start_codon:yes stop_codon:yes gene_type:complete
MLPKINTIVYACDLDGKTQAAMELVLSLAKTHGAKVILMHAIEPLNAQASNMINNYITEEVRNAMRKDAITDINTRMDKLLAEFMEKYSEELSSLETAPETLIVNGAPADSIQRIAKEKNADLIVMNSRTHGRLSQMIIGSTANKVIHTSSIPVLVVPIK